MIYLFHRLISTIKSRFLSDGSFKELLKGSAVTFFIKITGMGLTYLVLALIAKRYGAEGTGIYSLSFNILMSLAMIGGLGFQIAVLRFVGQFNSERNEEGDKKLQLLYSLIFRLVFPFSIAIGLCLYLLAPQISFLFIDNEDYIIPLKICAVILPFFAMDLVNVEFIRGLKKMKISEYLRSINRPLFIVILFFSFYFLNDIYSPLYFLTCGIIISFLISFFYINRRFKLNTREEVKKVNLFSKDLLTTAIPMLTFSIASFFMSYAGAFILEIYETTSKVGIFSICLRLSQLVSLILIVVNTISAPKFAELFWSNKLAELQKFINQCSKLIFFGSIAISLILVIFPEFFLGLFGDEFVQGENTLIILIVGQIFNSASGAASTFLNMAGQEKVLRNIVCFTAILVVCSYWLVIPHFGIEGAAIVSAVGSIILNIGSITYVYKKFNVITFYHPIILSSKL